MASDFIQVLTHDLVLVKDVDFIFVFIELGSALYSFCLIYVQFYR